MDDKQAAGILLAMLKKHALSQKEKEAINSAVGVLAWTTLAQSKLKRMGENKKSKNEKPRLRL